MSLTPDKKKKIIQRDGAECVNCGTWEGLTVDHFIPTSKGGTDYVSNLQTLCFYCNQRKGDTMPTDQEMVVHLERLANIKKNKPVDWGNLKIPNIGTPDGMLEYFKQSTDKTKRKKKKDPFFNPSSPNYMKPNSVKKTEFSKQVPRYVKYLEWNVYADFWLKLKKEDVGKIFRTDLDFKENQRWETALKVSPECYCESDKLQWNLSREHTIDVKKKTTWCWDSYNRSIEKRRLELV
jgi:5-methylcytosine-specific restriction protein A